MKFELGSYYIVAVVARAPAVGSHFPFHIAML